jgi:hypothetical protein
MGLFPTTSANVASTVSGAIKAAFGFRVDFLAAVFLAAGFDAAFVVFCAVLLPALLVAFAIRV